MKSNGYGSFVQTIAFKVPLSQAGIVTDALKADPDSLNEAMGTASFTIGMMATKRGDDETVVWKLADMLPTEVTFSIDWHRSEY